MPGERGEMRAGRGANRATCASSARVRRASSAPFGGCSLNVVRSRRWPASNRPNRCGAARTRPRLSGGPTALVLLVVAAACGSSDDGSKFVTHMPSDGSADVQAFCPFCNADSGGGGDANSVHSDFPSAPVIDTPDGGVAPPSNAAQLFGSPSQGAQSGGPCLIEPEIGSLYPKNWLRPRFRWVVAGGENLFELRLHVANQTNDLVVYTAATE
jgi:hypothetical protein